MIYNESDLNCEKMGKKTKFFLFYSFSLFLI